jgi:hypothetical protein
VAALAVGGAGAAVLIVAARSWRALNDGLLETELAHDQGHRMLALTVATSVAVWAAARWAERIAPRVTVRRSRARLLLGAGAATALLLTWAVLASADIGSRFESLTGGATTAAPSSPQIESRYLSRSGNGRTEYWKSSIRAWEQHPVAGIGAGTWVLWWERAPTVPNFVRDPHSIWFEALGELGTIGLLALMTMFGSILWAGWRAVRARPRDPAAPALLAVVAAFVVNVSVDWTWEITALGALGFVAAGLLVARPPASQAAAAAGGPPRHRGTMGRGLLVALIAWVAVFAQAVPLLSAWQVGRSQAAVRDGDLNGAERSAETARSVQPWAAGANMQLAQVLELRRDFLGARRYAAEAVRQEPTNWATWLVLSRVEDSSGDKATGQRYLVQAYRLNPASSYWRQIGFKAP